MGSPALADPETVQAGPGLAGRFGGRRRHARACPMSREDGPVPSGPVARDGHRERPQPTVRR
ncbi:hypothetical protein [Kitasatospora sp. NPDC088346]|uniref:hypothetical protein n=1 Tax=Kitasatospora sp. NPDC088346 TaxID=3364073 RepID=UPI0037FE9908